MCWNTPKAESSLPYDLPEPTRDLVDVNPGEECIQCVGGPQKKCNQQKEILQGKTFMYCVSRFYMITFYMITPPKFNIAPAKRRLEDYFPTGKVTFQGLC